MPPTQLPDDDLLPDERALLEGKPIATDTTPPAQAATLDPVDDDNEPATPPAAAPAPAPAAEDNTPAPAPAPAVAESEGGEVDQATDAAQRPTYEAPTARDFDAERKTLRGEKATLHKQWSDGELTDEDYQAKTADLDDKLDAILVEKTQAQTIENLNRQAVVQKQTDVLARIAADSKKAGLLDYGDEKTAKAFDSMFKAVASDPENEGKSFEDLANAAHTALCAVRGAKASAAPAPSPAPAPAPAAAAPAAPAAPAMRNIPQTLNGLPPASMNPVSNDAATSIAAMDDPDAAEAALAAMPASQRTELLRSTIRPGQGRR